MKKNHNIMIYLENIAIFREWSGVFPLGSLTVIWGRNSSGKTVIERALVAGYRPVKLARASHKAWQLQDRYLQTLGSEAGEIRISVERGDRVVLLKKGSRPEVISVFPGEERIGLMDAMATVALMRQKGFVLSDLGVSQRRMKTIMRESARVKKRMAERNKAVALDVGFRREIPDYDHILAIMSMKWGATRDYIDALLAASRLPPEERHDDGDMGEMSREEYYDESNQLVGRISLYRLGAAQLTEAIKTGTEQEVKCPCCEKVITAAEALEAVDTCQGERTQCLIELDVLREEMSRQASLRYKRQSAEHVRSKVPSAKRKLGIKRSETFDGFNSDLLARLLKRFRLPAPHKLVTDGEMEAATALIERYERLAAADPTPEVNRYLTIAKNLGITLFSHYRDGAVSPDGAQWYAIYDLSHRELAVVAVSVAAACRVVYESAAPILVADALLYEPKELEFLEEIARQQGIAVVATIADTGQLRM
jgi:hypothetical protein